MSGLSPNIMRWVLCSTFIMMMSYPVVIEAKVNKYIAQVRVFLDKKAHDLWKDKSGMTDDVQLKREITSYFVEMTDIYESLITKPHNISMQFEVESIVILDENILRDQDLDGHRCIQRFQDWHKPKYDEKEVDIAVLFTGDVIRSANAWGNTNKVCTYESVAVIEYRAIPFDIGLLAHEIGHVLGGLHDDYKEKDHPCYGFNGAAMNPSLSLLPKAMNYVFSKCTGRHIYVRIWNLNRDGNNCLLDGTPVKGPRFGEVVSLDNMCRRKLGKRGFALSSYYHKDPKTTDLCLNLHCSMRHWGVNTKKTMRFPQGGHCGKNKQCRKGKCVHTSSGSSLTSETCFFGDQKITKWKGYFNLDCGSLRGNECDDHKHECCYSCNKDNSNLKKTADEVCTEFAGDGWVLKRYAYTPKAYQDKMCSQLKCVKNVPGKGRVTKTFTNVPDGLSCGDARRRCNQGKCVDSDSIRSEKWTNECPWGNQDLKSLGFAHSCNELKNSCGTKTIKLACCSVCNST